MLFTHFPEILMILFGVNEYGEMDNIIRKVYLFIICHVKSFYIVY